MSRTRNVKRNVKWIGGLAVLGVAGTVVAASPFDFGVFRDRLLADRGLSRLLRGDWPKTLDELENRMRDRG